MADDAAARQAALVALDVDPKSASHIASNPNTSSALLHALSLASITTPPLPTSTFGPGSDARRRAAALVFSACGNKKFRGVSEDGRRLVLGAIGDGRINGIVGLEKGIIWLAAGGGEDGFEDAAGVGVEVDLGSVSARVEEAMEKASDEVAEKRYRFNTGFVQKNIMAEFPFVEGKVVREMVLASLATRLGPKTDADNAKPVKVRMKKSKAKPPPGDRESSLLDAAPEDPFAGIPATFGARDLASAQNTPDLLKAREEATGGKVTCRFPPEPNGYLHIGHAKAMFIDFGYAAKTGGETVLRFDDTNPIAEKEEFVQSIIDMVDWLGHKPARVTFSSDYFDKLHSLALELIRRGKAYICHQTGDEIKHGREHMLDSPYRNRTVDENLRLFDDMRKGKYAEGEAILRMKIDMQSTNSVMRDPIAYRVLHSPHARTGNAWCIYPSYDYTHCIVDSLEWITHSLCTLEFEVRRDSYYWLLEALDMYRPFVWEFARLSLEYTMMSKRKLKELVDRGLVSGWDDPRMPTLSGMRRRGYPSKAVNAFCSAIGASRAPNVIGLHVLEHFVRAELDKTCKRAFAVLRPLKVVITNFRSDETLSIANHPKNVDMGSRAMILTHTVFIERTDFRAVDEKNYYGLAPGKTAMLRHAYPITVVDVVNDEATGEAVELRVAMDYEKSVKPKGVLHWVSESAPTAEVRLISKLFKNPDPASLDKLAWLEDVDSKSLETIADARVESSVLSARGRDSFQFERVGYFALDDDTTLDCPVFNQVVSLRDSRPGK